MQTAQAPQAQGVTRNVTGPVEDRFKSQETRIQKLEQKLDDTMQQMQSFKQDTVHEFQKHQKEIGDMKDAFKSELIGLQKGNHIVLSRFFKASHSTTDTGHEKRCFWSHRRGLAHIKNSLN